MKGLAFLGAGVWGVRKLALEGLAAVNPVADVLAIAAAVQIGIDLVTWVFTFRVIMPAQANLE